MLYTLILITIRLLSNPSKKNDIEENCHCIIPIIEYIEYYPTQEELDDLV